MTCMVRTNGWRCRFIESEYLPYPLLQEQSFGFCRPVLHIRTHALGRAFDNDQFGNPPVLQTIELSFNFSRS